MPKSAQNYESSQHPFNQIDFMVRRILTDVHTGLPCEVLECFPLPPGSAKANKDGIMGLVHVKLMIDQIDNEGKRIETQTIYNVPYGRLQAGICAIVLDPVKGDRGWVQFAERDISTYKKTGERSIPASDRMLSQSDGWYFPGVKNTPPKIWIRLRDDGIFIEGSNQPVTVNTTGNTVTNCNNATVNAMSTCSISGNGGVHLNPPGAATCTPSGKSCCAGSCNQNYKNSCCGATPTGKMCCGGSSGSCSSSACSGTMKCRSNPVNEKIGKMCVRG